MIRTLRQQIVLLLSSPEQNDIWNNKQNIMKKLILIPVLTKNIYSQNQANNKTMKTQKLNTVMEFLADMVYTIALSLSR